MGLYFTWKSYFSQPSIFKMHIFLRFFMIWKTQNLLQKLWKSSETSLIFMKTILQTVSKLHWNMYNYLQIKEVFGWNVVNFPYFQTNLYFFQPTCGGGDVKYRHLQKTDSFCHTPVFQNTSKAHNNHIKLSKKGKTIVVVDTSLHFLE